MAYRSHRLAKLVRERSIFPMEWRVVAGLLLLAGLGCFASRPERPVWSGHPVVFVGVDSASWDLIDPMMARGELPSFQALVDRGARADLILFPPLTSPVVWTTFATGTFSRRHNILDFTYPYVAGEKRPVETTDRREPAVWNIASEHGRTVGIVGFYVTHPAEVVDGFVVSDAILEGREGTTYPEQLMAEVELVRGPEERRRLYRRFLPWEYDPRAADDVDSPYYSVSRVVRGRLDGAIVRDENVRRNALKLLPRGSDLFMTYFRIVDHASHSTWRYFDDSELNVKTDPAEKRLLGGVLPEAYRSVDEFLGEVIRQVGEDANIVVVSDHGAGPATGPYTVKDEKLAEVLSGNHRHDGILLAAGPDLRPGVFEGLTMTEVAPLILALLELPISEELPGRVPEELLRPAFLERSPAIRVPAYRKRWEVVEATADPHGEERALEQLKALGYLSSSTRSGRGDAAAEEGYWTAEPRLRNSSILGELLFYLMRGEDPKIADLMALVRRQDPELARNLPQLVRRQARIMQEDFSLPVFSEEALSSFQETYGLGPQSP